MKMATMIIALIMISGITLMPGIMADSNSEPPTIQMTVGDTFCYEPKVSLDDASFSVTGSAMASEGGFLFFDGTVLRGTATEPGYYTATVKAVWICPEDPSITQTVYQHITFNVSVSQMPLGKTMTLMNEGEWSVSIDPAPSTSDPAESTDVLHDLLNNWKTYVVLADCMILLLCGIVIGRSMR